jgi:hypothetical protein
LKINYVWGYWNKYHWSRQYCTHTSIHSFIRTHLVSVLSFYPLLEYISALSLYKVFKILEAPSLNGQLYLEM